MDAVCEGVGMGVKTLLDSGLEKARELRQEVLMQCAQDEVRE